jgi:hypothetical protein
MLIDGETSMTTGLHSFAMSVVDATTWSFTLDGASFGTLDLDTASSNGDWTQTLTEESAVPATFSSGAMALPEAISVLQGSTWMQPAKAIAFNTVGLPGVGGAVQDPTLPVGAIAMSSKECDLATGATLWDSAAVPTTYAPVVAALAAPAISLTDLLPNASVTAASGVDEVDFWAGNSLVCTATAAPFQCVWDTTASANGAVGLEVVVTDSSGQQGWVWEPVNVANAARPL